MAKVYNTSLTYHNMVFTSLVHLFTYNIFRALALYQAGALLDVLQIILRRAMVISYKRTLGCNIGGLHLCPVHLDAGEGHPGTFYACRPLNGVDMRHCIDKSLHQTEIAVRNGFSRP